MMYNALHVYTTTNPRIWIKPELTLSTRSGLRLRHLFRFQVRVIRINVS